MKPINLLAISTLIFSTPTLAETANVEQRHEVREAAREGIHKLREGSRKNRMESTRIGDNTNVDERHDIREAGREAQHNIREASRENRMDNVQGKYNGNGTRVVAVEGNYDSRQQDRNYDQKNRQADRYNRQNARNPGADHNENQFERQSDRQDRQNNR